MYVHVIRAYVSVICVCVCVCVYCRFVFWTLPVLNCSRDTTPQKCVGLKTYMHTHVHTCVLYIHTYMLVKALYIHRCILCIHIHTMHTCTLCIHVHYTYILSNRINEPSMYPYCFVVKELLSFLKRRQSNFYIENFKLKTATFFYSITL